MSKGLNFKTKPTISVSNAKTTPKSPIASSIPAVKLIIQQSVFDAYSDSAFVRESQLVRSPKRPEHPAPLPFSAPTLWRKVSNGTFPKPTKLSARITAWNVGDVRKWINAQVVG
jgi:predicted DNA-binding transcriptional regulator AlpA